MFSRFLRMIGLLLKRLLGKGQNKHESVNFTRVENWPLELSCIGKSYINDIEFCDEILIERSQIYPNDNAISPNLRIELAYQGINAKALHEPVSTCEITTYEELLHHFIYHAKIPQPWRNAGLYYAGYSLDQQQYILPSWIWTNGIVVEYLAKYGQTSDALDLANRLLDLQLDSGGWVVRYDYTDLKLGVSPVVAPNDSAHCADHGLLTAYEVSGDAKYLLAAEKCAIWIMNDGHDDGLILHGYNVMKNQWETGFNIVDIGFSAGLFCSLYKYTGKKDYLDFAGRFLSRYIELFYRGDGVFATSLKDNVRFGKGIFARGLSWALEGMIPYYELTNDPSIGKIVDDTVKFLLNNQCRNGGWRYNLRSDPVGWFSGYDNKGVPVIAASLDRWKKNRSQQAAQLDGAVRAAIEWSLRQARKESPGRGGVFSCNFEGAVIHSPNTSVAFVYSNCYLSALMREYGINRDI